MKIDFSCNYPKIVRDAGFKLRLYRDGPLDWRLMGSYETERILQEQNYEQVDNALHHLSEAPLGSVLDTNILDSGIAKTFLDKTVTELRNSQAADQLELTHLRKALTESNNEIVQLHKKMTQIEAIREVVYPCHLCTKNFISNEALNIHIERKHKQRPSTTQERHCPDTSFSSHGGKEKDDLNLINTIKMELEIKQLKERLNVAERNIKARINCSSRRLTLRESEKEVRSVAIQSNLIETKEKDDTSEITESEVSEQKEQLNELQARIKSFEDWQTQLKVSNQQFIEQINKKIESITKALDSSRQNQIAEESTTSPCLVDLERLLTEKISEIGRTSAAKLEEVVHHMEMGYKGKIEALERELKQLNVRKEEETNKQLTLAQTDSMSRANRQFDSERKRDDDTYSIEDKKSLENNLPLNSNKFSPTPMHRTSPNSSDDLQKPSSKDVNDHDMETELKKAVSSLKPQSSAIAEEADSTDITESLSDGSSSEEINTPIAFLVSDPSVMPSTETKVEKVPKLKLSSSKRFTRKDARTTVSKRLGGFGFDMKSSRITTTTLKRVNDELTDQRGKLKLKYPNFYATRNRIKTFVEKLCSSKLPKNAENLLKFKKPLQLVETPKKLKNASLSEGLLQKRISDGSNDSLPDFSREPFKGRLERLLSIPPSKSTRSLSSTIVQVHNSNALNRPVSLPQKRVMFSTLSSTKTVDESEDD